MRSRYRLSTDIPCLQGLYVLTWKLVRRLMLQAAVSRLNIESWTSALPKGVGQDYAGTYTWACQPSSCRDRPRLSCPSVLPRHRCGRLPTCKLTWNLPRSIIRFQFKCIVNRYFQWQTHSSLHQVRPCPIPHLYKPWTPALKHCYEWIQVEESSSDPDKTTCQTFNSAVTRSHSTPISHIYRIDTIQTSWNIPPLLLITQAHLTDLRISNSTTASVQVPISNSTSQHRVRHIRLSFPGSFKNAIFLKFPTRASPSARNNLKPRIYILSNVFNHILKEWVVRLRFASKRCEIKRFSVNYMLTFEISTCRWISRLKQK